MISSHFQRQVEKLRSLSLRFAEVEAGAKGGLPWWNWHWGDDMMGFRREVTHGDPRKKHKKTSIDSDALDDT